MYPACPGKTEEGRDCNKKVCLAPLLGWSTLVDPDCVVFSPGFWYSVVIMHTAVISSQPHNNRTRAPSLKPLTFASGDRGLGPVAVRAVLAVVPQLPLAVHLLDERGGPHRVQLAVRL